MVRGHTVRVLVVAAALAGSFAGGRATGAPAFAVPAAAPECRVDSAAGGLAPDQVVDLVRTAVRAELASARDAARTADPAPAPRPNVRTLHPELSARAGVAAERLIDGAIGAGRWEVEDQARLRGLLSQMAPERETALLQKLAAALNAGQLRPGFDGPLF